MIATVLSADRENDPDVVAMLGASVALQVSDIPFNGPLVGVRIGRIDGRWAINPTQRLPESDMDIFLSGSHDAIVMVEGGAKMVPEDEILEALFTGHQAIQPLLQIQEDIRREIGKPKRQVPLAELDPAITRQIEQLALSKLQQAIEIPEKLERYKQIGDIKGDVVAQMLAEFPQRKKILRVRSTSSSKCFRGLIIQREHRIDGRGKRYPPDHLQVEVLPRTDGSALLPTGPAGDVLGSGAA